MAIIRVYRGKGLFPQRRASDGQSEQTCGTNERVERELLSINMGGVKEAGISGTDISECPGATCRDRLSAQHPEELGDYGPWRFCARTPPSQGNEI